jgi:Tol biopolymer transport system component
VTALGLLAAAGAAYVAFSSRSESTAGSAALSIADLKVESLTTSGTASSPAISPDGNYVVYVENGGGRDSLRLRQVATGSNVELVAAEPGVTLLGATVTPDGAFVNFVRQSLPQPPELWQVPFLGGVPRRLLTGGRVGFSPDGRQVAFIRGGRGGTEVMIAASDGSNERVAARRTAPQVFWPGAVRQSFAPAWSPDGATLAVMGGKGGDTATGEIVFVDVKTGAERAVTLSSNSILAGTGQAWLDSGALLLSMFDRVSAPMQLWLLSYPEGRLRRLTNDTDQYVSPSLTADRSSLAVARTDASLSVWTSNTAKEEWTQTVPTTPVKGPVGLRLRWMGDDLSFMASASGGFALMRWRAATKTMEVLAQSGGNHTVSRDGSTMVFYDYDTAELWKADAAGRNRVRLARGQGGAAAGRLSPDGRLLVFVGPGPQGLGVHVQSMEDPGRIRQVSVGAIAGFQAAEVSPDGQSIAFNALNDRQQPAIAVCDLETCSSRRTLPILPVWRWMPDGQALAYVDPKAQSDLWAQPLDGSAPRQLTHFPTDGHQIVDFDWSADGKRLAVARIRIVSDIVLFRGFRPSSR